MKTPPAQRFALATLPALVACAFAGPALADTTQNVELAPVVVSANRVEQRSFDTAASIDVVNASQISSGQPQVLLSEPLARVPGIFALNRQNYAQDLLISSRGFGSNSAFGARGIRILVDGVPATMADGQAQISHIDLSSTDHIEVMRGPYSTLYGNASGGVMNIVSEKGQPGVTLTPYVETGSFGTHKAGVKAAGEEDGINFLADTGRFETDGYRQHSAATRDNQNVKLGFNVTADTNIQVVANSLKLVAQDPLGLNATQLQQDRTQAGTYADRLDTRKTVDQAQGGLTLTQRIDADNQVVISPYSGTRVTAQYQAPGPTSPTPSTMKNGVIDLHRDYDGINTRWLNSNQALGVPTQLAIGIEANENSDHRQTYDNTLGTQQAPSTASKNQDLSQSARNLDVFAQTDVHVSERTTLSAGLRNSGTTLSSAADNAASAGGVGSHTYQATTGMVSAQYYVRDDTNVYISYGTSFDTPTLSQVNYSNYYVLHSTTAPLTSNFGLQAATTRQVEIGAKSDLANFATLRAAAFSAHTDNDIVIGAANSGKTAYMNAPETLRNGLEFSAAAVLPMQFSLNLAYTLVDARVVTAYSVLTSSSTAQMVNSGNRIPGVPSQGFFGELKWQSTDKAFETALEERAAGRMAASDINSAYSSGYAVTNLRVVAQQASGMLHFTEFARVDNVFDRMYVGSVIVNQSSFQYYEAAPGRNWTLGASASVHF